MATRIENSRTNKRPQGTVSYDEETEAFVSATGRIPRLDPRGYPTSFGMDTNAVEYTFVPDEG